MKGFLFCRNLLLTLLFLFQGAGAGILSQGSAPVPDKKALRILVDSLATQLSRYYVDKEAAVFMGAVIRKHHKAGRYDHAGDAHELAGMFTADLRAAHADEHLHVEYNPRIAFELSGNVEDVPAMVAEKLNRERSRNFGFRKVEILDGNTGYLELSTFSRLNPYSKNAADAAMRLLSNSSAIIIDLRYGSGGSPDMMTYILGHFFEKSIPVSEVYIRSENTLLQYKTTPDSSFENLHHIPVYVLTSYKTFSAAEGFAYTLQRTGRATIVGEKTRGGAHTVTYRPLSSGFVCDIPFGVARVPGTKENWEKKGITPDIVCAPSEAPSMAQRDLFSRMLKTCSDSATAARLRLQRDLALSRYTKQYNDSSRLREYAGNYGVNTISFTSGELYYQKTGMGRIPLKLFGQDRMRPYGSDDFIIEFNRDSGGIISHMVTRYSDGREERSPRLAQRIR